MPCEDESLFPPARTFIAPAPVRECKYILSQVALAGAQSNLVLISCVCLFAIYVVLNRLLSYAYLPSHCQPNKCWSMRVPKQKIRLCFAVLDVLLAIIGYLLFLHRNINIFFFTLRQDIPASCCFGVSSDVQHVLNKNYK